MPAYLLRRLLLAVPLLFAVVLAAFALLYALPGDPVDALSIHLTEAQQEELRQRLGLNDPMVVQFGRYLGDLVLRGDLGTNREGRPVVEELARRLPATIELALAAIVIASIGGVSAGILAALRARRMRDLVVMTLSLAGVSVPIFLLGLIAQRLFRKGGVVPNLLGMPDAGIPLDGRLDPLISSHIDALQRQATYVDDNPLNTTGLHLVDAVFVFHDWQMFIDAAVRLSLPALVLASVPMAMIARITRAAVGEQLGEDYVRTARAKGLPWRRVVLRHALRNAAIAIVTSIGTQLGYLFGGAVLTEKVFAWPGIGTYMVDAINNLDARPLQASVLIVAVGFVVINLLVDVSYAVLDPRVRTGGGGTAGAAQSAKAAATGVIR